MILRSGHHPLGRDLLLNSQRARCGKICIVEYAKKYIALLRQHIDKEDTVLYQMGDERITNGKNKELLAGFDRIENERIGSGKHEQFHAIIDKLKNIYLG